MYVPPGSPSLLRVKCARQALHPSLLVSPPILRRITDQKFGDGKHACRGRSISRGHRLLPVAGPIGST
jgi:hypothetical protein